MKFNSGGIMKRGVFLFVVVLILISLNSCLIMVDDDVCANNLKKKGIKTVSVEKNLACEHKNLIKYKE